VGGVGVCCGGVVLFAYLCGVVRCLFWFVVCVCFMLGGYFEW